MIRYLIVGYSRSGTTATHLALMGHPQISALDGELKPSPFFTNGIRTFTHSHATTEEDRDGYRAIFDAITSLSNKAAKAVGAKTACNSAELAQRMLHVLRHNIPEMKVIHMIRDDVIAHYASGIMQARTGVSHSWNLGEKSYEAQPLSVLKRKLTAFVHHSSAVNRVFQQAAECHDYYPLHYERLLVNAEEVYRELFEFVGVDPCEVTWQNSSKLLPPPREYIKNFDQCQKWLETAQDPNAYARARIMNKLCSFVGC